MPQTISRKKDALPNSKKSECTEKNSRKVRCPKQAQEGENTLNKLKKEERVCDLQSKTPKAKTWIKKSGLQPKTPKRTTKRVSGIMNSMKNGVCPSITTHKY